MSVATKKTLVELNVNGEDIACAFNANKTLLEVLREDLDLTGTKHGCEMGHCGTCTVLVDDEPVLSCLVLGLEAAGHKIRTVEGLASGPQLHPVQRAFLECGAAQCGYCTPGFLVTAAALLERTPGATGEEIKQALAGCLCRCTGYTKIIEAVELAGRRMGESGREAAGSSTSPGVANV